MEPRTQLALVGRRRKRKQGRGAASGATLFERNEEWARAHVPDLVDEYDSLVFGVVAMLRDLGQLTPDAVRTRVIGQYGRSEGRQAA